jgi:hypothetical protein
MMLIHQKQLTSPLLIVKSFVDAGFSVSDSLAMAVDQIEMAVSENPGERIEDVLAFAARSAQWRADDMRKNQPPSP